MRRERSSHVNYQNKKKHISIVVSASIPVIYFLGLLLHSITTMHSDSPVISYRVASNVVPGQNNYTNIML